MLENTLLNFTWRILRLVVVFLATVVLASARLVEVSLDEGWRFHLGDQPGAEAVGFADDGWRTLDVPHDWAFEADYAPDAAQTNKGGYKPGGIAWYRKSFESDPDWKNQQVSISFDGVYMNSEVWIKGKSLGKRPYGYISYEYDLTPFLKPKENEIVVRVDSSREPSARWYHGCGIFGHVKLISKASVHVAKDGVCITTRFGIRTLRWDTHSGFWLNEKNVKLLGVCDHLEAGPVGAASPDELIRWKIQLLKDMGCNAIRTAHNPQVPAFYDLCDEMGMLVMDEIFDGWKTKAPQDYGKQAFDDWWERDLRDWLKRDRNHPSVIIWSLGNETGGDVAKELVKVCHELDPTRLVTSGHSGSEHMEVEGVNGASEKQKFFNAAPHKAFVATEAPHTWQVRGFYRTKTWFRDGYPNKGQDPFPCPDLTDEEIFTYDWTAPENKRNRKQIFNSSYDNAMVRITAGKNCELRRDLPWYSGHFRWTGFDYLGEAGYVHGGRPFRVFMGGPLDLAGFKKDLYFFYQSQ